MKVVYRKDTPLTKKEINNLITFLSSFEDGEDFFLSNSSSGISFNLGEDIPQKSVTLSASDYSKEQINIEIRDIISYLNMRTGKRYSHVAKANIDLIKPRLKEYAVDQFKTLIDNKCDSWLDNPEMAMYLRPETLFSKKHFESYLNEKPASETEKDLFGELESYSLKGQEC